MMVFTFPQLTPDHDRVDNSHMCRSIKTLRPPFTEHAGDSEYHAAALQYVRKVSGFRAPSTRNQAVFDEAVAAIAAATAELMDSLTLPRAHTHTHVESNGQIHTHIESDGQIHTHIEANGQAHTHDHAHTH